MNDGQIRKVTVGFVTQVFDINTGTWVSQEFTASDQSDYEYADGSPVPSDKVIDLKITTMGYLPFDMVQPGQYAVPKTTQK